MSIGLLGSLKLSCSLSETDDAVMIWQPSTFLLNLNPGHPGLLKQQDWQISKHICNQGQDDTYGITNQGVIRILYWRLERSDAE
jgi:hypothetical protein